MAFNLTVSEAAKALGVSAARVYQLINSAALPADRIGRTWLLDDAAVSARAARHPAPGRPLKRVLGDGAVDYVLMNRAHEVLEFSYDPQTKVFLPLSEPIDPARAPLGVVSARGRKASGEGLSYWWRHRSIPSSRDGLAIRLKELGLDDSAQIPFKSLGLSLSDQYWIRPAGLDIAWENVNFFHNGFDLDPADAWTSRAGLDTPDNTSEGELPKQWRIEGGLRVLLKGASALGQEPLNEVIATELHSRLLRSGEFVPYSLTTAYGALASQCSCFVSDEEEYIPAYYVRQTRRKPNHLNDYRHFIECCVGLGVEDPEPRLSRMIVCDDIMANRDRHWRNFGVVRNVETLECRMAPLFDTGSSLWCDAPVERLLTGKYAFSTKPFYEDANRQLRLVDDYSWLDLHALDDFPDFVERTLCESAALRPRASLVADGVCQRIERIERML